MNFKPLELAIAAYIQKNPGKNTYEISQGTGISQVTTRRCVMALAKRGTVRYELRVGTATGDTHISNKLWYIVSDVYDYSREVTAPVGVCGMAFRLTADQIMLMRDTARKLQSYNEDRGCIDEPIMQTTSEPDALAIEDIGE